MTRMPLSRSKGQLVADALNSQHAGTGDTWRINAKILSTCRGRRHIVSPRAQLVICSISVITADAKANSVHYSRSGKIITGGNEASV